jgi:choline dehydrogenase-like flavoprotein
VLRFHWKWSDYETKQMRHSHIASRQIIEKLGGKVLTPMPTAEEGFGIQPGGEIIHEAGTTRMGDDPKTSVLNRYCQAHEAKNVFVVDAGPFVSNAHKNATWTIMALAWRTADYIGEQTRKGSL